MSVSMRDVVTARKIIAETEGDGHLSAEQRADLLHQESNWTRAYIRDLLAYIGPRKVSTGKF